MAITGVQAPDSLSLEVDKRQPVLPRGRDSAVSLAVDGDDADRRVRACDNTGNQNGGRALQESLPSVMPWGRSLEEYVRMFDLRDSDLASRILDCAAGPAGFNAEMHRRGCTVVSCDPIYRFSAAEIARRIDETCDIMLRNASAARANFVWTEMQSPERLGEIRMAAMRLFVEDFSPGLAEGRYRCAELPSLPFRDAEFDLAVCSHFLFTYSQLLPLDFHVASVRELCRVAKEARLFPLLPNFGSARSSHAVALVDQLTAQGYRCEIQRVRYEFQKGGNEMLRVVKP
jgi:hypothetical protein